MTAYETTGRADEVRASPRSPASCSSTSGRSPTCAATTRPTSPSPSRSRRSWRWPCTARRVEVEPASKVVMELGRSLGGKYLGDEISAGDWASRHDRYATPLHGRATDGQAVMMSWHCEDAALNYSVLPQVREEWHAIVARYREQYGIFDDWGMFAYTSGPHRPWARLPGGDRRRHLGVAPGRRDLGRLGGLQARDRRGEPEVRRLDHRLPRRDARGRRRARADRDGQRLGGGQARSSARWTRTTS